MKFNVTEIEFDFDDDYAEESKLTFDEEKKSKSETQHLEYGMQTMKMTLSKKSHQRLVGVSKTQIMRFN